MIATHTPKMFKASIKSPALAARLNGRAPSSSICSQTTSMRRELWAAPKNAADIKKWRETVADLPEDFVFERSIPDVDDPFLKQILLPHNSTYVSVTPVASMGLSYELFERIREMNIPYKKWVVQPNASSIANHGEALLLQHGTVRLLRRGPAQITQGKWRGDFIQLTARCEGMNISSGMLAVGFPAMTAIGGFIHSLERKLGEDIQFAFGIKHADWKLSPPKITTYRTSYGTSLGRVKGGKVVPVSGYATDEILSNCEIVILLRVKAGQTALLDLLEKAHRVAGGILFDMNVSAVTDGYPPEASYLLDASKDIDRLTGESDIDNLQAALKMYAGDGKWVDKEWVHSRNGYTLNQTGYALLETPKSRNGSRGGYLHAWAEPTFSLITQGSMSDNCWWSRVSETSSVFWKRSE